MSSMEFPLLSIFAFLTLSLVFSHAALPSELYWKSVLPNTIMPKAISSLLHPDTSEEKTTVGVRKGGVTVTTGHKGKPVHVGVQPGPFMYKYAATEDQLHDNPNVALFFLEKDLKYGTKMNLHFTRTTPKATFLPREEETEAMKKKIKVCEEPAMEGEEKFCAASLESMIDFSTSKLGTNVQVMATEVNKKETLKQEYIITRGVKKMKSEDSVVCHGQTYEYAVFYCHTTHNTMTYVVPLIGTDGTKADAVAVCHKDTLAWNPNHLAFKVLKVKPGTVPICHFLPEDHIVWVST